MLHGKTLRAQANGIFPFTVIRNSTAGQEIGGIDVVLLDIVAKKLNFNYTLVADARSILYQNGTPGAALGEVILMAWYTE